MRRRLQPWKDTDFVYFFSLMTSVVIVNRRRALNGPIGYRYNRVIE